MKVEIYTDGSCLGNGKEENFGGYGLVVVVNGIEHVRHKRGFRNTTNNRMELMGVLSSVEIAKKLKQSVNIYCDSSYCVNTVNDWMKGWAAKGWKKSDKKTPENLDIIKELYSLLSFDTLIHIIKVKGHADDKFNNIADRLAVQASSEEKLNYEEIKTIVIPIKGSNKPLKLAIVD